MSSLALAMNDGSAAKSSHVHVAAPVDLSAEAPASIMGQLVPLPPGIQLPNARGSLSVPVPAAVPSTVLPVEASAASFLPNYFFLDILCPQGYAQNLYDFNRRKPEDDVTDPISLIDSARNLLFLYANVENDVVALKTGRDLPNLQKTVEALLQARKLQYLERLQRKILGFNGYVRQVSSARKEALQALATLDSILKPEAPSRQALTIARSSFPAKDTLGTLGQDSHGLFLPILAQLATSIKTLEKNHAGIPLVPLSSAESEEWGKFFDNRTPWEKLVAPSEHPASATSRSVRKVVPAALKPRTRARVVTFQSLPAPSSASSQPWLVPWRRPQKQLQGTPASAFTPAAAPVTLSKLSLSTESRGSLISGDGVYGRIRITSLCYQGVDGTMYYRIIYTDGYIDVYEANGKWCFLTTPVKEQWLRCDYFKGKK